MAWSSNNARSNLLSEEENEIVFTVIGNRRLSKATTVVQMFHASPDSSEWTKFRTGVVCLVKDNSLRSYFIRLIDISARKVIFEQELFNQFTYNEDRPHFHSFPGDKFMIGLNFADTEEATKFKEAVESKIDYVKRSTIRIAHKNRPPGLPPVTTTSNALSVGVDPFSLGKKKPIRGRKLNKADIGIPSDFRHLAHVGWDPKTGAFNGDNIDPEWKKFLDTVGVTEEQLQDQDTAQFIYDFIEQNGGIQEATRKLNQTPSPPPANRGAPPPPLPSRGRGGRGICPPPPPPHRSSSSGPPPPPPPSHGGANRGSTSPFPPPSPPLRTSLSPLPSDSSEPDYSDLLMKAAEAGTIDTRWTNVTIGGASGAGKTSFLKLILDEPPPKHHHSTPAVQPLPVCILEDNNDGFSSDESDEEEMEHGLQSADYDDQLESHLIMIDNEYNWKVADENDIQQKIAECTFAFELIKSEEFEIESSDIWDSAEEDEIAATPTEKNKDTPSLEAIPANKTTRNASSASTSLNEDKTSPSTRKAPPTKAQFELLLTKLQVIYKIIELMPTLAQHAKISPIHFIHILDTGGQASFIDIAPALVRFNSVNIIVHKLSEGLNETANFYYSRHGKKVGEEHRNITNKELLSALISARRDIRQPEVKGMTVGTIKPRLIMVGTYYDKYKQMEEKNELKETIEEKNEQLMKELEMEEDVRYDYKAPKRHRDGSMGTPDTIFPLNTISREKREKKIAKRIRKLASKTYMHARIPLRWYLVQVELTEMKSKNEDIIPVAKLVKIGSFISMGENEVKACLKYFHDLTICLYFHKVLPNIVFLSPNFLLKKVSDIVAVSICSVEHSDLPSNVVSRLVREGIFDNSMLDILKNADSDFKDDLFSVDDFVVLLQHLLIIIPVPDGLRSYFMPSALVSHPNPINHLPPSSKVSPVFLKWKVAIPCGLFPSLCMAMYQSTVTKVEPVKKTPVLQYRNRITLLCPELEATIVLFEHAGALGVTHTASRVKSVVVLKAVMEGIGVVVEKFQWEAHLAEPDVGFVLPLAEGGASGHKFGFYQRSKSDGYQVVCHEERYHKIPINKSEQLPWFTCEEDEETTTDPIPPCTQQLLSDNKPELCIKPDVLSHPPTLETAFGCLKVVSSLWDTIGRELKLSFNDRRVIEDYTRHADQRLEMVLYKWIEGKTRETSWKTIQDVYAKL